MKRLMLCLALVLPLALASTAAAKEVVAAKVCGATDCRTVKDREALLALQEGGSPTDPPAGAPGFFRAELTVAVERGKEITFPLVLVPDAGLIRGGTEAEGYTWMSVSAQAAREHREITRGLAVFPYGKLEGLDAAGLPEARVDEVVAPPAQAGSPEPADGGTPVWPWIAGGLAAATLLALTARRVRRRSPGFPNPAEG